MVTIRLMEDDSSGSCPLFPHLLLHIKRVEPPVAHAFVVVHVAAVRRVDASAVVVFCARLARSKAVHVDRRQCPLRC